MKQLLPIHPTDEEDLQKALKIDKLPREYVWQELAKCEAKLRSL
jgi:hypothetical protein